LRALNGALSRANIVELTLDSGNSRITCKTAAQVKRRHPITDGQKSFVGMCTFEVPIVLAAPSRFEYTTQKRRTTDEDRNEDSIGSHYGSTEWLSGARNSISAYGAGDYLQSVH